MRCGFLKVGVYSCLFVVKVRECIEFGEMWKKILELILVIFDKVLIFNEVNLDLRNWIFGLKLMFLFSVSFIIL